MIKTIQLPSQGQGLHEITHDINNVISASSKDDGLCTIFIKHTSCSLTIQENADPSARNDLQNWLNQLVSEDDPIYTHTFEGKDDMPAHIKAALTATTLSIPYQDRTLCLGTWQGVFLWEHRYRGGARSIVIHLGD